MAPDTLSGADEFIATTNQKTLETPALHIGLCVSNPILSQPALGSKLLPGQREANAGLVTGLDNERTLKGGMLLRGV